MNSIIVVTADVHIHPFKVCSNDAGADRLRDGLSALRQGLEIARRRGATWVMAGDFKQPKTNWPQEALTGAHEILREYDDVQKVMIAGNHDAMGLGGSGLAPFKDCATVVEWEAQQVDDLLCVPFGADLAPVKPNKHLVIIGHAFLQGVFIGPESIRLPAKGVPVSDYGAFPVAFFGDIHRAQFRRSADPMAGRAAAWQTINSAGPVRIKGPWFGEVYYPGSPYQQNWGERNDGPKGVLVADLKRGSVEMVALDAPRFVHVELEDCEALPQELFNREKDFVRILTDSAKRTQAAIEAKGLTFRWAQIIERPQVERRAARSTINAAMDRDEMLAEYMKARPVPDGVDPAQCLEAGRRLWSGE